MRALLALLLAAQATLLQIRVVDGEGAVHLTGARAAGPVVEITDEIGKPISGAVVSFRLPDEGPSGAFANGLASEIVTTGPDGRATTSPIRWNRLVGPLEIRVTVVKDRLRAGTVIAQYLADTAPVRQQAPAVTGRAVAPAAQATPRPHRRRTVVVLVLAGVAGAGFAAGWAASRKKESPSSSGGGVDIGAPAITIEKP